MCASVGSLLAVPGAARASGEWVEVSCVNPNGSAAPNTGWTTLEGTGQGPGSSASTNCGPSVPMTAVIGQGTQTFVNQGLFYQPPEGTTLAGGQVDVALDASGYGSGAYTTAGVYAPDVTSPVLQCVESSSPRCGNGANSFSGVVNVPAVNTPPGTLNSGLYVSVACNTTNPQNTAPCDAGATNGVEASARLVWAHLLLATTAQPAGSGFSGSVLQPGASGTANLVFTATDLTTSPGVVGPGVYNVTATLDGRVVYSATPNTNNGQCAAVGTDPHSGALMFDSTQPCPPSETVDVPVPTAGLSDGPHALAVSVTDAAQNTATVLDQTITTANPTETPLPKARRAPRARFIINWSYSGAHTTLLKVAARHVPRRARVTVTCSGPRCPRGRAIAASGRRVPKALAALDGRRYRAGDRLYFTVVVPHRPAERVGLRIRDNRQPQGFVVSSHPKRKKHRTTKKRHR